MSADLCALPSYTTPQTPDRCEAELLPAVPWGTALVSFLTYIDSVPTEALGYTDWLLQPSVKLKVAYRLSTN